MNSACDGSFHSAEKSIHFFRSITLFLEQKFLYSAEDSTEFPRVIAAHALEYVIKIWGWNQDQKHC